MITERNSDWPTWPWQTQQKAWGLPRHRWIWASIAWNSLHGTTVMLPLGKKESWPPLRGHMILRRSPTNAQTHDLAPGSLTLATSQLSQHHTHKCQGQSDPDDTVTLPTALFSTSVRPTSYAAFNDLLKPAFLATELLGLRHFTLDYTSCTMFICPILPSYINRHHVCCHFYSQDNHNIH